jgi:hypothetical protein
MTSIIIKALLGGLGWLRSAWRWLWDKPYRAIILALCLACVFLWRSDAAHVRQRDAARTEIVTMKAAMNKALAASRKLEQAGKELARAVDVQHERSLESGMAAAADYIKRNRVPKACAVRASTPAEGDGARVPESLPSVGVVVSEEDVRACTGAMSYAISAHEWAVTHQDLQDNGMPGIY